MSLAGFRTAIAYSQAASPTLQAFRLALSSDKVCRSTIEMFRLCSLFYAIAKSSEATAETAPE